MEEEEEIQALVAEQQRELMAAKTMETDFDMAFRLQVMEAMRASLGDVPSSSSADAADAALTLGTSDEDISAVMEIQAQELKKFNQETKDRELHYAEAQRAAFDLKRCAHDAEFAIDLERMPREEWEEYGDVFERPIDEGTSSGPIYDDPFHIYFKGLVSQEFTGGKSIPLASIGVAVCDPRNNVIFKIQKSLDGSSMSREATEAKALYDGLLAALSLDIRRVKVFFDYRTLYQHAIKKWSVKQRKVADLIKQVHGLIDTFDYCRMILVPRCHVKHVYKFARDAIDSQMTKSMGIADGKVLRTICKICLEETDPTQMHTVDGCSHIFCSSCMQQHVEVKLLYGILPECPHDKCNVKLTVDSCKKFLTPKLVDTMSQRIKEAAIPESDRLYCPYPKCSSLMSRKEMSHPPRESPTHLMLERSVMRRCVKCNELFCLQCVVPWHHNISCDDYKILHPFPEDERVCNLAKRELWRQCAKCNHMIELGEGCFHMTCRCGYQFCYVCGAEWRNKRPTCSCPLWEERYIRQDHGDSDGFYDEDEDLDSFDSEDDMF